MAAILQLALATSNAGFCIPDTSHTSMLKSAAPVAAIVTVYVPPATLSEVAIAEFRPLLTGEHVRRLVHVFEPELSEKLTVLPVVTVAPPPIATSVSPEVAVTLTPAVAAWKHVTVAPAGIAHNTTAKEIISSL